MSLDILHYQQQFNRQCKSLYNIISECELCSWFVHTDANRYSWLEINVADNLYDDIDFVIDILKLIRDHVDYDEHPMCFPITETGDQLMIFTSKKEYEEKYGKPLRYADTIYDCISNIEKLHEISVKASFCMEAVVSGIDNAVKDWKVSYPNTPIESFIDDITIIKSIYGKTKMRERILKMKRDKSI